MRWCTWPRSPPVREAREDPGARLGGERRRHRAAGRGARRGGERRAAIRWSSLVSTGEVYGAAAGAPRRETDPLRPVSPYAASKVGAEVAALEAWRRTGLRVVIARPFTHTGPGQTPSLRRARRSSARLRAAKAAGAAPVPTGNLEPVRDLLDVRDVVRGLPGAAGSGARRARRTTSRGAKGCRWRELFARLADLVGRARRSRRPTRPWCGARDIPHLVGDSTKLRRATGWAPAISLDQTLRGLVDAEAD